LRCCEIAPCPELAHPSFWATLRTAAVWLGWHPNRGAYLAALDLGSWTPGDWDQILNALFTAVAALAACASVLRIERDRQLRTIPDLHVEVLLDMPAELWRLAVVNHGGLAREVTVMGVIRAVRHLRRAAAEHLLAGGRTAHGSDLVAPLPVEKTHVFVEGWDMAKRRLVVGTVGGATYQWKLRKAKKLSDALTWKKLFPDTPPPHDARHWPMNLELVKRIT
jgi:hypothetical protein